MSEREKGREGERGKERAKRDGEKERFTLKEAVMKLSWWLQQMHVVILHHSSHDAAGLCPLSPSLLSGTLTL